MPWMRERLWCRSCQKETWHVQQPPSHLMHFLLTLVTLGWWVIPWIWVSINQDRPRCTECGVSYSSQLRASGFDELE